MQRVKVSLWCLGLCAAAVLAAVPILHSPVVYDAQMSLREFAAANHTTPREVRHDLQLSGARGRDTLGELGIDRLRAARLVRRSGLPVLMTVLIYTVLVLAALLLVRRHCCSGWPAIFLLGVALFACGAVLGKTANPMVALVKAAKSLAGIEVAPVGRLALLTVFALLAIIGTKAVCGWACPFGALQELLHRIPLSRQLRARLKPPFWLTNTVRIVLAMLFVAALTTDLWGLRLQGQSLYHPVNPFRLFDPRTLAGVTAVYLLVCCLLAVVWYRPHCQLVCPFGLVSWLLERVSIFRVRINRSVCTECQACVRACPGQAMQGIYAGQLLPADCFSCGACLEVCPVDAITYAAAPSIGTAARACEKAQ